MDVANSVYFPSWHLILIVAANIEFEILNFIQIIYSAQQITKFCGFLLLFYLFSYSSSSTSSTDGMIHA